MNSTLKPVTMKKNEIRYPRPEFQGKSHEQDEASVKAIIAIVLICAAIAVVTLIWNYFKTHAL